MSNRSARAPAARNAVYFDTPGRIELVGAYRLSIFSKDNKTPTPPPRTFPTPIEALFSSNMRRTLTLILLTAAWMAVVWLSSSRSGTNGSRGTIWRFLRGSSVSSHSSISANRPLVGGGLFSAALAACVGCWACFGPHSEARGSPPYSPQRRALAAAFLDNHTTRHYTSLSAPAECPAWIQQPSAPMGNSMRALATSARRKSSSMASSASGKEDASNTTGKQ